MAGVRIPLKAANVDFLLPQRNVFVRATVAAIVWLLLYLSVKHLVTGFRPGLRDVTFGWTAYRESIFSAESVLPPNMQSVPEYMSIVLSKRSRVPKVCLSASCTCGLLPEKR